MNLDSFISALSSVAYQVAEVDPSDFATAVLAEGVVEAVGQELLARVWASAITAAVIRALRPVLRRFLEEE